MFVRFDSVKSRARRAAGFWLKLLGDSTAGTTVLVAFAAPVFVGALGVGIDTSAWYIEKRKIQQQADAAALGGARVKGMGQTNTTALAVATRDAQRNGYVASATTTLTFNSPPSSGGYTGKSTAVEVIVTKQLPSLFSSYLLGVSARTVTGRAVGYTPYVRNRNLEVAVVLDVSNSMAGNTEIWGTTKMEAQQAATNALLDIVVSSNQSPYTSRASLVPFSDSVNVGSTYFHTVTNKSLSGSWSGVVERTGSYKFKDEPPSSTYGYFGAFKNKKNTSPYTPYLSYFQNLNSQTPANASRMRPLSSDKATLQAAVNGMTTAGSTAGHLGIAWAWYTLSPKWSSIFTGTAAPAAYDSTTTYKAIVIMSDFDMNSYYESANGSANTQFDSLCTQIKAAGVKIFTIGYGVSGSSNNTRRINCASNDTATTYTYTTSTVADMLEAFEAIANSTVIGASEPDLRIVE
ncbi:MAG: pilus assembly protein TadG-related protein [Reyranellaceae bacterium]